MGAASDMLRHHREQPVRTHRLREVTDRAEFLAVHEELPLDAAIDFAGLEPLHVGREEPSDASHATFDEK